MEPATAIHKKLFIDGDRQCVGVRTVRRRLHEFGLFGRAARKKPFISPRNRKRRVEFAKRYLHWTVSDWAKILFSDETKVSRFGSDGRQYVRRRPSEEYNPRCLIPTVKGAGGCVMVWGCFSRSGVGPIHRIEGIMDRFVYVDILQNVLEPYAEDHLLLNWVFQQDNDPKHTSAFAKEWFRKNRINVLDWPSQSPDLNPIEHMWAIVKKDIRRFKPSNLGELFDMIRNSWQGISHETCAKMVDTMPKRCRAVIKSFGYPTRY